MKRRSGAHYRRNYRRTLGPAVLIFNRDQFRTPSLVVGTVPFIPLRPAPASADYVIPPRRAPKALTTGCCSALVEFVFRTSLCMEQPWKQTKRTNI